MVNQDDEIKIIDFGLSHTLTSDMPNLMTQCGTPGYAAPEMIIGQPYTKSADIWSLGITLYAMVVGELPFVGDTKEIFDNIVYDDPEYPRYLSKPLVDLLKRLLNKSPNARITVNKIKQYEWFDSEEYETLVNKVQAYNDDTAIDESILSKMRELGLNSELCRQNLADGDATALTSVYYQLRESKRKSFVENPIPSSENSNSDKEEHKVVKKHTSLTMFGRGPRPDASRK
ncbi:carbon catabolite derepressing protein kinase [Tritrichomonas foetus]|uniref:Carbon catabolite derepressing protein kinase n=1 Tax=Tritrichomonas foetus TaxID=1144522 RepID=A0A1J4KCU2_9EUKA|nr:carbon catabolite derepressing protein kinase [Tritrichomonas foetus]|eukprot:OHT09241.1 carbon catabolite derepressing protein kinase [Tritrichomonas foetus]